MDETVGLNRAEASPVDALVIGAGPAGLMAAEVLTASGHSVLVADAKPSVGRKFLMAGKSGLNLTADEPSETLIRQFGPASDRLAPMVQAFDAAMIRDWARGLGQNTFVGSSGRVFPTVMKASPLLRAWLGRLAATGARIETRWRWSGEDGDHVFDTPQGPRRIRAKATILALGGASWARLGSDGLWRTQVTALGAEVAPFRPANAGLQLDWSDHMIAHFGFPVKGTALLAGGRRVRAEFVISRRGLEGGGIYAVFADVRDGASLALDLLPELSVERIASRLASAPRKASRANRLRRALRLDQVRIALLNEFARPLPDDSELPALLKCLPVPHGGPRPLDEAISTAGGVTWESVDNDLMLKAAPGIFVAGEMLDWEAPTGGYLLTACLASGRWAGQAAGRWLNRTV